MCVACIVISALQDTCTAKQDVDKAAQADDRALPAPDISMLHRKLQQQWHADKNMHLGPVKIKPQSNIKAVWQCNKCPAGQPHIWTAVVSKRTQGSQCPFCCNRLVCLHNSLAAAASDAAQYWNHSKNEKTPGRMLAGSHFRAEWKCPTCAWEWEAPIEKPTRTRLVLPNAVEHSRSPSHSPLLLKSTLFNWLSGTTSAMMPRGLSRRHYPCQRQAGALDLLTLSKRTATPLGNVSKQPHWSRQRVFSLCWPSGLCLQLSGVHL